MKINWNNVGLLAIVITALLVVGQIAGCAHDPISPEEYQTIKTACLSEPACMVAKVTVLSDEKAYERADRLQVYQDSYRATLEWCRGHAGYVMFVDWHCRRLTETSCPPKHITDSFNCIKLYRLR